MNKNPLRYECIARDFLLYVITIQVAMVPLNWLPYCGAYRTKSVCENPYNTRYLLVL